MTPLTQTDDYAWHALPAATVSATLECGEPGLTDPEAISRREKWGDNRLPEARAASLWWVFGRQFLSPLIYLLLIAALISIAIGDWKDAAFIVGVLAINASIGTYQEWKAEQSSRALRKLLKIRAVVVRDGHQREIDAQELVPGDLILLEPGNRVPADVRLSATQELQIDESLLTGESLATQKNARAELDCDTPLGDRDNMAFAGSVVVRGRGRGWVVATGLHSQVGQLALEVTTGPSGNPPLIERMERFTRVIAVGTLVISALIGLLGWGLDRMSWDEVFLFVVALAVAAIPEGLPVAITVALAIAASKMAKRRLVVRRLTAVEGLGSCTLIATDKTGTLTCNEMTVRRIVLPDGSLWSVTGEGFTGQGEVEPVDPRSAGSEDRLQALALAALLCNEGELVEEQGNWRHRGDPVDVALLALADKIGVRQQVGDSLPPSLREIPFESETKYAASFRNTKLGPQVFLKGAPEKILAMCPGISDGESGPVAAAEQLAIQGYRVLALAQGTFFGDPSNKAIELADLQFLGLVAMLDPLRPGVREAVQQCHQAGVAVAMVTGDHPGTALSIARELGLGETENDVVTGVELEHLTPPQWIEVVRRCRIFSRVSPSQKLSLVRAAQRAGHFVAVTGDGVNDAPALKTANVSVAMGQSGTDVAREAAQLVITDDNFATIVAGIEEGRIAYDNIRKVIYLLLSGGAAELAVVLLTIAAGLELPLLPVQLLWLNLVTNGIQGVAMAFEPGEPGILRRPPRRPDESIFNRLMIERMLVGTLVMGGVGFLAFWWLRSAGWSVEASRNFLLILMVLFENVHVGNCRSETRSALRQPPWSSPILLLGSIIALGTHVIAMHTPGLRELLGLGPMAAQSWLAVILLALLVLLAMEIHKWVWRLRHPSPV